MAAHSHDQPQTLRAIHADRPYPDGDGAPRKPLSLQPPPLAAVPPVLAVCAGILLVNGAVVLWLMLLGRGFLPPSVPLQWWSASIRAEDNSQHLMDLYSFLHAMSGAALCFAARGLRPGWPVHMRLLAVIASSGVWEAVENTPWVIAIFNDPLGPYIYRGDSIVNALSDSAFVIAGFLAARAVPRWGIITAGVAVEIGLAVTIRDGFVFGAAKLMWR